MLTVLQTYEFLLIHIVSCGEREHASFLGQWKTSFNICV